MGIFKKLFSGKKERDRLIHYELRYDEILDIIKKEFITGADVTFLATLYKTILQKEVIDIANTNYTLYIDDLTECLFLEEKDVGQEKRKVYALDNTKNWKKFYDGLTAVVKEVTK